jgi:hypothetical protein
MVSGSGLFLEQRIPRNIRAIRRRFSSRTQRGWVYRGPECRDGIPLQLTSIGVFDATETERSIIDFVRGPNKG